MSSHRGGVLGGVLTFSLSWFADKGPAWPYIGKAKTAQRKLDSEKWEADGN